MNVKQSKTPIFDRERNADKDSDGKIQLVALENSKRGTRQKNIGVFQKIVQVYQD